MKKELLELIKLRALEISDAKKQIDICQYFADISFFSKKISEYKWLSKKLSREYHNLTIGDFVNLSDIQLSKLLKKSVRNVKKNKVSGLTELQSYYCNYAERMENYAPDLESFNLPDDVFANFVLERMNKNEILFDAGVALFYDDSQISEKAKEYAKTRN